MIKLARKNGTNHGILKRVTANNNNNEEIYSNSISISKSLMYYFYKFMCTVFYKNKY